MAGGDRQSRTQRTRLLALVALLCWLLAGAAAFVGAPQMISVGIAVLGLVLAGAVWHALGSMTTDGDALPVTGVGAPGRAFESIDPTAVFDRESAEIERLREVEGQLRLAKQAAESATLAKGEFLATMSHEIRTPLNGIVPLIDVVLSSSLNVDQRQCLETAYSSAQQLLSIVDDILDYSKIEANRLELESVSINLRELVDSVAQLMAHPAQAKNVALSVRFDPNLRPIQRGDPVRLRQLLTNLVSNAVKFTDKGSVTVQVGRRGETGTHTQVLFAIVDTGAGIDADSQMRLFQPFTQADSSVTRVFGGTGLGLAICRRLVELMGGEIGVKSTPGHGSTFWFSVPLLKAPGDIATPAHGTGGGRALVVSADQTLIRELAAFFAGAGIQHTQTSLSSDAVARLRGNPKAPRGVQTGGYQFAFLDWTGMRLTAQSMARGLLRDPALAHLRIVLLAQPQDEVPEDLRRHSQVLIHPRVFEAGKLRAALDSDGKGDEPLRSVDDLLRTGAHDTRDLIVAPTPSTPSQSSSPTGTPEIGTGWKGPTNLRRHGVVDRPPAEDSTFLPPAAEDVNAVSPPDAAPRRVLLVEDNPVNRQVAQRLLSIGGLTVDVAEEGASALSMRFSDPPLAILMDCQMPVMDGYASTRAIRERETREGLPRMPIIAMTANAMLGDREKCLQAGMDDYLSKPLDRKALSQTLDRWLAVSEGRTTVIAKRREVVSFDFGEEEFAPVAGAQAMPVAAAPAPRVPEPVVAPAPVREPLPQPEPVAAAATEVMTFRALDGEVIDDLIDMMGADFTDLVRIYLHDAPLHVAELHAAAQSDDLAGLVGPAHILKSSSANLGALVLAEHARQIEAGARQGTLPRSAGAMTTDLETAYLEASSELTQLLSMRGD